jgi:hypothetical protein
VRWGDRLATARRRGFVGREAELSRFRALLADPDEPRVVYVHGPGGIGKSALLHQFGWLAEQAGRRRVWLDGREVQPDAETVVGLLGSLEDDLVLLVDGVDGLDRLLREEVLPRLADGAVVVLTGRDRPSAQWRTDPGWRELVEVMPLGNLAEAEGRKLLLDRGVADDDCGPALAFTRGHPLALALAAHAALHGRAAYYRDHFYLADPQARAALLLDFLYLHRDRSVLGPFLSAVTGGLDSRQLWTSAPRTGEWPLLRDSVARHEGEDSAALFDHWRSRQPEATSIVRDAQGTPVGFYVLLRVEQTDAADRAADPALAGLPRDLGPGERATFVRFWLEGDAYQQVGAVQAFLTLQLSGTYLSSPGLAWTFLAFAEPGFWADGCAYLDYHRIDAADFTVGGRTYGVYGHDWRTVPPLAWLSLLAQREDSAGVPALGREEFAQAVKDALRGLGRAEGLRDSPLLDTGLVPGGLGESERAALREAIADAAAELEASPRDRRAFRALHHTYLRPAATQQAAADLLDLPMSTYRRHLAEGIARLTDLLWQRAGSG